VRGLIRTQSGVKLRLYVKCRGGEEVGEKRVLSLGRFFFFFCNHAFIVFRYKKPHGALAMERTKPINQKHKHKKVTAPISIHYRAGFSSAGSSATCNKESTN